MSDAGEPLRGLERRGVHKIMPLEDGQQDAQIRGVVLRVQVTAVDETVDAHLAANAPPGLAKDRIFENEGGGKRLIREKRRQKKRRLRQIMPSTKLLPGGDGPTAKA